MTLNDVTAVECRMAELSGERPVPAQQAPQSVGAFAALLGTLPNVLSAVALPGGTALPAAGPTGAAPLPSADLERLIAGACATTGDDPALVKAIVANESGFNPAATSPVGAQGLMQLMPGTAAEVGVRDAYDPAQNIAGGTRYLAHLLQRFNGDVPTAVAAYNAGPEAIARGEMPTETQHYVRSVMDSYAHYRTAKPSS